MSLLRPYNDGGKVDRIPLPAVIVDDEIEYFVKKIIAHRDLTNDRTKYLVKKAGYRPEENTWLARSADENTVALDHYLDG